MNSDTAVGGPTTAAPRRDLLVAWALTAILALLALFQLALMLGAPWGRFAWGGQYRVLPAELRVGSGVALVCYVLIDVVVWARVGVVKVLPARFTTVAMWVVFANFAISVVLNAVSPSTSERTVMVPVSLVLAGLSFALASGVWSRPKSA